MYEAVQVILNDNQASWNTLPGFSDLVNNFNVLLQQVKTLSLERTLSLPGVTVSKQQLRLQIVEKSRVLVGALHTLALVNNDPALAERANHPQSSIYRASRTDFKAHVDAILRLCIEHLVELEPYGVDQAKIDELQALRDACEEAFTAPRVAIVDRVAILQSIRSRMKKLDLLLRKGLDNLMLAFEKEAPEFYTHYKAARLTVDLKARKRGPEGPAPERDGES